MTTLLQPLGRMEFHAAYRTLARGHLFVLNGLGGNVASPMRPANVIQDFCVVQVNHDSYITELNELNALQLSYRILLAKKRATTLTLRNRLLVS